MAEERDLRVNLQFGLEDNDLTRATTAVSAYKQQLEGLTGQARDLKKQMSQAVDGQAVAGQLRQVEAEISKLGRTVKAEISRDWFEQTRRGMEVTMQMSERMMQISSRMAMVGGAILFGAYRSAENYVKVVGQGTEAGRAWLSTNRELEQANLKMGESAAKALEPYRKLQVMATETVARVMEKNPALGSILVGAGAAITSLGGLGTILSQGIRMYADSKLLAAAALQSKAAGDMLKAAGIQAGAANAMGGGAMAGGLGGLLKPLLPGAAVMATGAGGLTAAGGVSAASLAAAVSALPIAIGTGLGLAVNEILARLNVGGAQTTGKWASVAAYGAGKLGGGIFGQALFGKDGETIGREWFAEVAHLTGEIDDLTYAAAKGAEGVKDLANGIVSESAVKAFMSFQEANTEALKTKESERQKVISQYAEQRTELEAAYAKNRAAIISQYQSTELSNEKTFRKNRVSALQAFQREEASAEADYYKQRKQLAKQYGLETLRQEQDHQRERQRAQEDHEAKMASLAFNGDAVGMWEEMQRYEVERRRAEEDYVTNQQRRQEDFSRQAAEQESEFKAQRAARMADFAVRMSDEAADFEARRAQSKAAYEAQLKELDAAHSVEMAKLAVQKDKTLRQMDEQFTTEQNKRREAFNKQLVDLGVYLGDSLRMQQEYYQVSKAQFLEYAANNGNGVTGARGGGGYAGYGRWLLGERGTEFVLNADATKQAEKIAGGRLSQESLLRMMQSQPTGRQSGRGGRGGNANQQLVFNGTIPAHERKWLRRTVHEGTVSAMEEAFS